MKVNALLSALLALHCGVFAEPLRIETALVDAQALSGATFQSNNQKVVQNKRGIFMTHLHSRNEAYTAQQWRLSWSQDGGRTFKTLYEATDATNPPVLETDAAQNIYVARPDWPDLANRNVHLHRFLSAEDYREPHRTVIPKGASGKYSMAIDEPRGQLCYFSHNGWFHRVKLDGMLIDTRFLTQRGTMAVPEYTHMHLDATGVLHAAWTSLNVPIRRYWGIHHMQSADGGTTWRTFTGTPLPLPIIADESGATDRITLDDEFDPSTWLASMHIKDGKAHFLYNAVMKPPRQHHVRIDFATGRREIDHQAPSLKGEMLALGGLDGFFASKVGSALYCVSRSIRQDGLVCLISRDDGATWHDYAVSDKFNQPYAVGGCRSITADGYIIGSFTELEGTEMKQDRGGRVWFFKIKAG